MLQSFRGIEKKTEDTLRASSSKALYLLLQVSDQLYDYIISMHGIDAFWWDALLLYAVEREPQEK